MLPLALVKKAHIFIPSCILILFLVITPPDPAWAAYWAYVPNSSDHNVSVIDVAAGTVVNTIDVGVASVGVGADPTGRYILVASYNESKVYRIDAASGQVDKIIAVGQYPYEVAFSPDGTTAYSANSDVDTVSRIDVASGTVTATIHVGEQPMALAVHPTNGYVYVSNFKDDNVSRINPATNTEIDTIAVGNGPQGLVFSPDGQYAYVATPLGGGVSRINVAANTVDATIAAGVLLRRLDVSPDGQYVYGSDVTNDVVRRIDTAAAAVDKTIAVGDDPQGISVTPDGRYVFVANQDDNTVSRIDVASAAVDKTITVGDGPKAWGRFIISGPSPDRQPGDRQPGGPAGLLGGGGNNPPPLNPAGQGTIIDPAVGEATGGTGLFQTRMVPLAGPGEGGSTASNFSISSANPTPGLMYRLTDPTGAATESWLPLAGSGELPNGVHWTGATRYNYDVRVVDLTFDWPAGFIGRMAPGRWTVEYWFQTESGLCSNKRWEFLDVVSGSSTDDREPAATGELTFNLMLSVFSSATNQVAKVTDGLVKTVIDDETYDSWLITDGAATIRLPFGQDCRLCFLSDEFTGQRNLDCRFENGLLRITEAENNNEPVAYYEDPSSDGYCLEYYRDRLYVCNPGNPAGPVMGLLYGE